MLASLKTIYTAFSFLKSESVSTSLQRTDQQKRVDQIASTFLNNEFAGIAQIKDVSEGLISAALDLSEQRHYYDENVEHTYTYNFARFGLALSFGEALRPQAIVLCAGDHVRVHGNIVALRVRSEENSGKATRFYPVFFAHYPLMQIDVALISLEVTERPNYESLKSDLDRKDRSPAEEEEAAAKAQRLRRKAQRLRRNDASKENAGTGAGIGAASGGIVMGFSGCVSCLNHLPPPGHLTVTPFNLFTGLLLGVIGGAVIGVVVGIAIGQMSD